MKACDHGINKRKEVEGIHSTYAFIRTKGASLYIGGSSQMLHQTANL